MVVGLFVAVAAPVSPSVKVMLRDDSQRRFFSLKIVVANRLVYHLKGIRIPECGKFLLMESGIPGSGIRNTAQGRNPESHYNDSNPGCKFS